VLAWLFGVIGYTIAGIVLTGSSIGSFDRLAGRTVRRPSPLFKPAPAPPLKSPFASPGALAAEPVTEAATDAILLPPSTPDIL
jgi:hypothetical protein